MVSKNHIQIVEIIAYLIIAHVQIVQTVNINNLKSSKESFSCLDVLSNTTHYFKITTVALIAIAPQCQAYNTTMKLIITWILHQNIMYSNKVKLVAS